jgi:uncharacterized protein (TIRG00374 family)
MGLSIKKSILSKGFVIFIILSVAVIVGILLWTTDRRTWFQVTEFKLFFIPILLGLATFRWFLDGMAFVAMDRHNSDSSLGIGRAAVIRLEGSLVAAVVPVLVGTFSMHAYLLHKERMKLSESMAMTVLRAILPVFLFLLNIPILFFMKTDPASGKFFAQFIKVISLPLVVIVVFFIITLFYPHQIKNVASSLIRWWGRIKFIHIDRIIMVEERLFHEIDQFSKIFWTYIRERKLVMLRATVWILAAFLADYFMALSILWGFGFRPSFVRALAVQFLMRPIIFIAPTPGGAGIWEFTYLGFYSLFMPQHLIGVAVLMWRLLITYFPSIAGVFFLTREFKGDEKLRQFLLEKGVLPEEKIESLKGTIRAEE